jgi:uncharacterized protein YndB with AHSA1/START domain
VRLLKGLVYAALALAGLCLLVGLFLPSTAHVERTVTTSASPDTVYGIVSSYRRFNEWSPWFDLDPQARYTYSGPESGVGAKMAWTSDKQSVGSGSQEILAVEPGRMVKVKLDFGSQGTSVSTITIAPEGAGSRVTWAFDTSFEGNFPGRYFGLMFDKWIGSDYAKGLARLKALAEAEPVTPSPAAAASSPGSAAAPAAR